MAWAMVIAAGLLELVWSYSAKRSDGFTRLGGAFNASLAAWHSLRHLDRHRGNGSFLVGIAALGESAMDGGLQAPR